MALQIDTQLGGHRIFGPLGAGRMGELYRAQNDRLGRSVAIKVLPSEFSRDSDRQRHFEEEAGATSALNHPYILVLVANWTAGLRKN